MTTSIIVAISAGRVIGHNNTLPWHAPEDLAHFKQLTQGGSVIMGRKTYESIGRPLPNRNNFVVSSTMEVGQKDLFVYPDLLQAVISAGAISNKVFIIGGQRIFTEAFDLELVDNIYLTHIKGYYEGDTFFPKIPVEFNKLEVLNRTDLCTMCLLTKG